MLLVAFTVAVATAAAPEPSIYECAGTVTPEGQIDKLVMARLSPLSIQPALCSDAVFVRRVYLDVIGTLPTTKEAREFIADPDTPPAD